MEIFFLDDILRGTMYMYHFTFKKIIDFKNFKEKNEL